MQPPDHIHVPHVARHKPNPTQGSQESLQPGSTIEESVSRDLAKEKFVNPTRSAQFSEAVYRITNQVQHNSGVTWNGAHHLRPGFKFQLPTPRQIHNLLSKQTVVGKHAGRLNSRLTY
jgi:hypothetical protein